MYKGYFLFEKGDSYEESIETGTAYVLQNYLGYSEDACDAWFHEKDVYLNIEGGMWGGWYMGSAHTIPT